ncbi:MAG TPA: glycosyltransferase [Opitutales bacterium]|nr:glycosyltransferase [Opitutales bacterium]
MSAVLDLTHTAHVRSATGVQRVARQLYAALAETGAEPQALVYDPFAKRWRVPDKTEQALLHPAAAEKPGTSRSEVWTLGQKLRGYLRGGREPDWVKFRGAPLLVPEIFSAENFPRYADLRAKLGGPAVAVFYDAVALRLPQLTPAGNVARIENYLRELAAFDGVAAISAASRVELLEQWTRLGVREPPPVTAIPLGVNPPPAPAPPHPADNHGVGAMILSVGSIEGRKNHLALLGAAEMLWRKGRHFRLILAGLPRKETAAGALGLAQALQSAGRPLQLAGVVSDQRLEELYARCRFTVYPSLYEGYGLPVAESLVRARPCICGTGGALGEVALGGGCLVMPEPSVSQLVTAMDTLLDDDALHARLCAEAAARQFPTWADYARQLHSWARALSRRTKA